MKLWRFEIGKWYLEYSSHPDYAGYICALNFHRKWIWGFTEDWYDGPHKSIAFGWFNFYWNWG